MQVFAEISENLERASYKMAKYVRESQLAAVAVGETLVTNVWGMRGLGVYGLGDIPPFSPVSPPSDDATKVVVCPHDDTLNFVVRGCVDPHALPQPKLVAEYKNRNLKVFEAGRTDGAGFQACVLLPLANNAGADGRTTFDNGYCWCNLADGSEIHICGYHDLKEGFVRIDAEGEYEARHPLFYVEVQCLNPDYIVAYAGDTAGGEAAAGGSSAAEGGESAAGGSGAAEGGEAAAGGSGAAVGGEAEPGAAAGDAKTKSTGLSVDYVPMLPPRATEFKVLGCVKRGMHDSKFTARYSEEDANYLIVTDEANPQFKLRLLVSNNVMLMHQSSAGVGSVLVYDTNYVSCTLPDGSELDSSFSIRVINGLIRVEAALHPACTWFWISLRCFGLEEKAEVKRGAKSRNVVGYGAAVGGSGAAVGGSGAAAGGSGAAAMDGSGSAAGGSGSAAGLVPVPPWRASKFHLSGCLNPHKDKSISHYSVSYSSDIFRVRDEKKGGFRLHAYVPDFLQLDQDGKFVIQCNHITCKLERGPVVWCDGVYDSKEGVVRFVAAKKHLDKGDFTWLEVRVQCLGVELRPEEVLVQSGGESNEVRAIYLCVCLVFVYCGLIRAVARWL